MWEEWEVHGAFFKVLFLSKDSREEAFHLPTLQKRADWVADEPVNYLERLFVRQRLQKRFSFSSVSVYKVKWSLVCQKWISGGDSEALGSSHRVQHANAAEAGGWFWWHYSTRWFSLHAQTGARFTLGWVFIALTPPPTLNAPSLHVTLDSAEVRFEMT